MTALEYFAQLKGKSVYFLGVGVSHKKLIDMFAEAGADVTLRDIRTAEKFDADYLEHLSDIGVKTVLGPTYLEGLEKADYVFRSPGIDYMKPEIQKAVADGANITSEIETFFDLCPCKTIGITGSDGKTTTTTLTYMILKHAGKTVHLGGNIGEPLLPRILEMKEDDYAVVELSSFQLISMKTSPDVSIVTNLTPNHLDHHKDLEEYYGAKRNILSHQGKDGVAILLNGKTVLDWMAPSVKGSLYLFGDSELENGAYFDDDYIYTVKNGEKKAVLPVNDLKLRGRHNRFNACAAALASSQFVDVENAVEVLSTFTGVEHRIEPCGKINGASYYNDSIATSPTRTTAGLKAFDQKIVLIAGGYDKKLPFDDMAKLIVEKVKTLIVMGDTGPKIEAAVKAADGFDSCGIVILHAEGMENAVEIASENTSNGDVVLMSPASSSFDHYRNFEERGRHFKSIVAEKADK